MAEKIRDPEVVKAQADRAEERRTQRKKRLRRRMKKTARGPESSS